MALLTIIDMLRVGIRRSARWPIAPRITGPRRFVASQGGPAPNKPQSRLSKYIPHLDAISTKSGLPLPSLAVSFAILHELTAILPLVALFFAFQAFGIGGSIIKWASQQEDGDDLGLGSYIRDWLQEGQKRVDKVARRYGMFGYEKGSKALDEADQLSSEDQALQVAAAAKQSTAAAGVANAVAAYVVVKVSAHTFHYSAYGTELIIVFARTGDFAFADRSVHRVCTWVHAIRSGTVPPRDLARCIEAPTDTSRRKRKRHQHIIPATCTVD